MKLGARDIAAFLKQPDRQAQAALLYGPDGGLVRERSRAIVTALLGKDYSPLNRVELTGMQVKSDPALLLDELSALSLMGGRRTIIIRDINDKIEQVVKSAFEGLNTTTFLIIEADELAASSPLRKLFENDSRFAAIACYLEEGRNLEDLIRDTLSQYGLRVQGEAMAYLIANLGNDRAVTRSELDKIALYMGEEKEVTLEKAMLLTGDNASESVEDLCHSIALDNPDESGRLLMHLLREGVQPVAITRALIRYFQRLDIALSHVSSGQSRQEAIKMLRPPVFYKSVPIMEKVLARLSPNRVSHCLNLLLAAEKEIKSGLLSAELVISNLLLALEARI